MDKKIVPRTKDKYAHLCNHIYFFYVVGLQVDLKETSSYFKWQELTIWIIIKIFIQSMSVYKLIFRISSRKLSIFHTYTFWRCEIISIYRVFAHNVQRYMSLVSAIRAILIVQEQSNLSSLFKWYCSKDLWTFLKCPTRAFKSLKRSE